MVVSKEQFCKYGRGGESGRKPAKNRGEERNEPTPVMRALFSVMRAARGTQYNWRFMAINTSEGKPAKTHNNIL